MFSDRVWCLRKRNSALLICVVFLLSGIYGCGGTAGSSGNGPGAGGGAGGASSAPAKFVYALDATQLNNPSIAGFSLNNSTGVITQIGGSPFSISPHTSVETMTATPATSWVFIADWFNHVIEVFRADPNSGALSVATTVNTPELKVPLDMVTDGAGKFLFVADPNGMQIGVYSIGGNGSLTPVPGSPFKTSAPVAQLTVNSAANLLYAAADNLVFGFTVGSDGALTPVPGSPVTVRPPVNNPDKGPTGVGVAVDPAGRFLFVSDATAPQTWVYAIGGGGSLSLVAGSPFATPGGNGVLTVSPDGRFVFEGGFNVVGVFQVQANGALSAVAGSPFPNGPNLAGGAPVNKLVTDPQGKFLLLADTENSEITVFSIDPNSGVLTNVPGSPFPVAATPIGGGSPATIAITH